MTKRPTKEAQELDRTRITISFGLISFFLTVLFFQSNEATSYSIFGSLNFVTKPIFALSLLQFFLFIVCTASQYKTSEKGILDGAVISPASADYYFDSGVEWSFVGISIAIFSTITSEWFKLAKIGRERCGEGLLYSICSTGFISGTLILVFGGIWLFRKSLR